MSEILFLAHRVPAPPDRGDKIRSHHLLRALAELAPLHLATFAESDADLAAAAELVPLSESRCVIRRNRPLPLAALQALATGEPVSLPAFRSAALARYIARTLAERPIAAIVAFSSQMAQYVPAGFAGRVVLDFVDVDSAKFEAYARDAARPVAALYRREARLLRRFEERSACRADRTLFVTAAEAALFASRLPQGASAAIGVIGNGIDTAAFDPGIVAPAPELATAPGPHIVFTGQMDYPPNAAAVERFAHRIMPQVRSRHPACGFHIVGRSPTAAVRSLDRQHGCRVWGEVPDVRPWLAAADLAVAPLTIARGLQNKVLEAMAMARPVLVSREAATGIDATAGEAFAVADDDAAMTAAALELLDNPERRAAMGAAAREFVVTRHGWDRQLAPLRDIVLGPEAAARDAA